jgi:hypothetical protein
MRASWASLLLSVGCGSVIADLGDTGEAGDWAMYWGDLHAHSGWSYDGCEDPDAGCAARGLLPGEDLLSGIEAADLDFVALTDHAEADLYLPQGEGGAEFGVWDGQAEAVLQAQATGRLVLLGFEWSGFRSGLEAGHAKGSHRTVLLSDPTACEDYRVPGWELTGGQSVQDLGSAVYTQERSDFVAETPLELWAALEAAALLCDPVSWTSFAHHSAYAVPQQTDWGASENEPFEEQVVEIYSEHGSSECIDLDQESCDWRINETNGYVEVGSIQAALGRGFRLGFVAGSDSHDARPGSIEDGPGPVGHWEDTDDDGKLDSVMWQFTSGGLTGVWLKGELSAESLLEAIDSRQTIASSGIRPLLKLDAKGRSGERFLMGESIPSSALPLTLSAWTVIADWEGQVIYERIGPGGVIEDSQDGESFAGVWDPQEASWTYLRIRYISPDGTEERVWISPWFTSGPEPSECGCASDPQATPLWALISACVLLGIRCRRGRCPNSCVDSPQRG